MTVSRAKKVQSELLMTRARNLDDFGAAQFEPLAVLLQEEDADGVRLGHEVLVAQPVALHRELDGRGRQQGLGCSGSTWASETGRSSETSD